MKNIQLTRVGAFKTLALAVTADPALKQFAYPFTPPNPNLEYADTILATQKRAKDACPAGSFVVSYKLDPNGDALGTEGVIDSVSAHLGTSKDATHQFLYLDDSYPAWQAAQARKDAESARIGKATIASDDAKKDASIRDARKIALEEGLLLEERNPEMSKAEIDAQVLASFRDSAQKGVQAVTDKRDATKKASQQSFRRPSNRAAAPILGAAPAAQQPAAEQSLGSVDNAPAAQQPATEQPAAQQPATEQPAAQQPAAQ